MDPKIGGCERLWQAITLKDHNSLKIYSKLIFLLQF